jgi:hypothetical protein
LGKSPLPSSQNKIWKRKDYEPSTSPLESSAVGPSTTGLDLTTRGHSYIGKIY